jgi:hypothetical protein
LTSNLALFNIPKKLKADLGAAAMKVKFRFSHYRGKGRNVWNFPSGDKLNSMKE